MYTIIMGDFYAKIGEKKQEMISSLRPFGIGERNKRGQRLIEFMKENKLKLPKSYLKKHPSR